MIVALLNVRCTAGHWHYAPPRELSAWIGHECLQGARMKADGFPTYGRCQALLSEASRAGRARR